LFKLSGKSSQALSIVEVRFYLQEFSNFWNENNPIIGVICWFIKNRTVVFRSLWFLLWSRWFGIMFPDHRSAECFALIVVLDVK
jgi:hypothetical protein